MQPIWRKRATIATAPHLSWEQQEQFLVDCASKEGMSGALAIYYSRDGKINTGNIHYQGSSPISILHGIYVGKIGIISELEAQIGKVWKRNMILANADIGQAIKEKWPKENKDYANMLLDKKASYKYILLHSVMKKVNIEQLKLMF